MLFESFETLFVKCKKTTTTKKTFDNSLGLVFRNLEVWESSGRACESGLGDKSYPGPGLGGP